MCEKCKCDEGTVLCPECKGKSANWPADGSNGMCKTCENSGSIECDCFCHLTESDIEAIRGDRKYHEEAGK